MASEATPLAPPTVRDLVVRALRLRCPACGRGRLYARWLHMYETCPVCGLKFERDRKTESAAFARTALDGDPPIHQFDQAFDDRQSQAAAAIFAADAQIGLGEIREDSLLLLNGNADASIADHEVQQLTPGRRAGVRGGCGFGFGRRRRSFAGLSC